MEILKNSELNRDFFIFDECSFFGDLDFFFENYLEKVIFKIEGLDDKEVNSG